MKWLNYHHLFYFWTVVNEGGLVPAGKVLHLSHPTLSTQIHALEDRLGEKLLQREGRRLVLTEAGRVVYRYAGEIFGLGRELLDTLDGRPTGQPVHLNVGIVDALPKLAVQLILEPAFALPEAIRLVCHEGSQERLLAELSTHSLDLVIADSPIPPGLNLRAYNHLLGESAISFFASPRLAGRYSGSFPASLDNAPFLLPASNLTLRRAIDHWLDSRNIRPRIVGEFDDSALLKVFGAAGHGIFPAPEAIAKKIIRQYGVRKLGTAKDIRERFYAISGERRLKNPAIAAICERARQELFY